MLIYQRFDYVGGVSKKYFLTRYLTVFSYYVKLFQYMGTLRGHYWVNMVGSDRELCDAQWISA